MKENKIGLGNTMCKDFQEDEFRVFLEKVTNPNPRRSGTEEPKAYGRTRG